MSLWWTFLWLACLTTVTQQRHIYTALDFPSESNVLQRFYRMRRSDDDEEDDEGVDKPRPLRFG
ncbi:hypothetical protein PRIPAC_70754 [Pristionchus pacificus]|uniref:Uncharacterized protein n=1 Tax=Pristionchus pacificus TaxID=54126 RepID=A0A2A6CGQ5_PRIPA|nr:hypothetical protein PRIPAC_70754 [Pristionchus pacificus]|eukprot:PDM77191.1 hypothetical protein PRIPAC_43103 [Pristionchus pacificus]